MHVLAAGRTDSGVHATGQVANFHSDIDSIAPERFRDAVNSYLPNDVRIIESEEVGPRFHARRSARLRLYRYYTVCGPVLMPHVRNYRHWIRRTPDLKRLTAMATTLLGEHDFSAFAAEGDANLSKVRRVDVSTFDWDGVTLVYTIAATSFLWKMVRTIMGTFLMLEEQGLGERDLRLIMETGIRSNPGGTAPGRGLFLERVDYESTIAEGDLAGVEPAGGLDDDGLRPPPSGD